MWDFAYAVLMNYCTFQPGYCHRVQILKSRVHCESRADIALEASECDNKNALPIFTGARATGFTHGPSARVSLAE